MPIYKRTGSKYWTIDITTPSGRRIRRSSKTVDRKNAQELHDKLKAQLWDEDKLGVQPDRTFDEACLLFLKLSKDQKDFRTKQRHVKHFLNHFSGRSLSSLKIDEIIYSLPTHRIYKYKSPTPISNGTKNRYLASIKRILKIAHENGWVPRLIKLPSFHEQEVNIRWITKDEAQLLLSCITNKAIRDMAIFALMTGCRQNEIFNLTWKKVDMRNKLAHVTADTAKSEKSRAVPLNKTAIELLNSLPNDSEYVFLNSHGEKFKHFDRKAYQKGVKAAGLEPLTFHDLRHTWASWHAQDGTPLLVLKELGGWKKLEMVLKYAHLAQNHLSQYSSASDFTSQLRLSDEKKVMNLR